MQSAGPKTVDDVSFEPGMMVAVKMRGLPWRVEESQIEEFFEGFGWVRDSIRIGELEGGRRTGQGAVLFESPAEATRAMEEKEGEYVGPRFVQMHELSYAQWKSFMTDQLGCKTVDLKRILKMEDMGRAVRLRGLPRDVQMQDVLDFFKEKDFNITEDQCHIEMRFGNKTGWGLVFLDNEQDV